MLFSVLAGEADIAIVAEVNGLGKILKKYNHNPATWKATKHWVKWWTRPMHLSKLVLDCSLSIYYTDNYFDRNACSLLFRNGVRGVRLPPEHH